MCTTSGKGFLQLMCLHERNRSGSVLPQRDNSERSRQECSGKIGRGNTQKIIQKEENPMLEPGELDELKKELQGLQNRLQQLNKQFETLHISRQPADESFKKLVRDRKELRRQFVACQKNYNSLRLGQRRNHDKVEVTSQDMELQQLEKLLKDARSQLERAELSTHRDFGRIVELTEEIAHLENELAAAGEQFRNARNDASQTQSVAAVAT